MKTCLVLAIVLLRVSQHPVAESQHVLEVSIALVPQILQLQHWTVTLITEWSFQDAKYLKKQKQEAKRPIKHQYSNDILGYRYYCGLQIQYNEDLLSVTVLRFRYFCILSQDKGQKRTDRSV